MRPSAIFKVVSYWDYWQWYLAKTDNVLIVIYYDSEEFVSHFYFSTSTYYNKLASWPQKDIQVFSLLMFCKSIIFSRVLL